MPGDELRLRAILLQRPRRQPDPLVSESCGQIFNCPQQLRDGTDHLGRTGGSGVLVVEPCSAIEIARYRKALRMIAVRDELSQGKRDTPADSTPHCLANLLPPTIIFAATR